MSARYGQRTNRQSGMVPRVLLVADEALGRLLTLVLEHVRATTRTAGSATEAIRALREWRPHLVLADLPLVQDGGLEKIRKEAPRPGTPCILLLRRSEPVSRIEAFQAGADDVIPVPFSADEVIGRVIGAIRRAYGEPLSLRQTIDAGDLQLDVVNGNVRLGRKVVRLSPLQQAILYLLAASDGRVVSRNAILDVIWGLDREAQSNVVDRHVRDLRQRLGDEWRRPRFMETVPGRGYRFLARPSRAGQGSA